MSLVHYLDGERFVRFLEAAIAHYGAGEFQAVDVVAMCQQVKDRYLDQAQRASITDMELATITELTGVMDLVDPAWIPASAANAAFARLNQSER